MFGRSGVEGSVFSVRIYKPRRATDQDPKSVGAMLAGISALLGALWGGVTDQEPGTRSVYAGRYSCTH